MNNTALLKLYLTTTAVSVALFLLSFAVGWHTAENMGELFACSLPFLLIALASLAAFGFTPETDCHQVCATPNVIPFKVKSCRCNYNNLRKIS
jgi:hypothetical protein